MNEPKNIVWIASYPKSGNTWFRVLLSNLIDDQGSPANINKLKTTPIASSRVLFDKHCGTASSDLTPDEIEMLRPEMYRKEAGQSTGILFKKVHDAWTLNQQGKALFPSELTRAVVYIIRNPLDIAVSYSFHTGKSISETIRIMNDRENALCAKPVKLYNQLRQILSGWSRHVSSWVDESGLPLIVLRYEDLLVDPVSEFGKALNFIGMDVDENKLAQAVANSSFSHLKHMENEEGFKEKPINMEAFFRSGKSNTWSSYLNPEEVKILVRQNRILMERFGYLSEIYKD